VQLDVEDDQDVAAEMLALLLRVVEVTCRARPFMWLDLCKRIVSITAVVVADDSVPEVVPVPAKAKAPAKGGKPAADAEDELNDITRGADMEGGELRDVGDDCASCKLVVLPAVSLTGVVCIQPIRRFA